MDIFEDIIATLLIDVIRAQNRANEYSAELVPDYRDPSKATPPKDPNLVFFPVPNSVIRSFDFKLSFALEQDTTGGPAELFNGLAAAIDELFTAINPQQNKRGAAEWKANHTGLQSEILGKAKRDYLVLMSNRKKTPAEKIDLLAGLIVKELETSKITGIRGVSIEKLSALVKQSLMSNVLLTAAESKKGLAVNLNLDQLKVAGENILASVSFQVDMRNYQLGFTDDTVNSAGDHAVQHRLISTAQ